MTRRSGPTHTRFATRPKGSPDFPPTGAIASLSSSRASEVTRPSATGKAADAFAPYQLIWSCLAAREDQLYVPERIAEGGKPSPQSPEQACGDLSPGQIAGRLHLLDIAAKAGVHGAAHAVFVEGLGGLGFGVTRGEDDPEYLQWATDANSAVAVGAAHGDYFSLRKMADRMELHGPQPDYEAALRYTVAPNEAPRAEHGADLKNFEMEVQRLRRLLSQTVDQSH